MVTGSRAEYGLLKWVMEGIKESSLLELQVAVTGAHLSPEFGYTVEAIERDGFPVDRKVEMLLSSETAVGVTKSMGLGLIGFADALADLDPDLMLVLGDRYEIFSAVVASMIAKIPVAHLHGGETTEGAYDEAIRHSITKMSHLHFVANEYYRKRVIQLGEDPSRVFAVGGLGVDSILKTKTLCREELEIALGFKFQQRNLLVTFQPATLESERSAEQLNHLLGALAELGDTGLIFTMPNADKDGRLLAAKIDDFCASHKNARAHVSLGQLLYFSCMNQVDGVIGNSSSGLLEAPSFKVGTINIGTRQRGRLQSASVINCDATKSSIKGALSKLFSLEFQRDLENAKNPYGDGGSSEAIVAHIEQQPLENLLVKHFHDLH